MLWASKCRQVHCGFSFFLHFKWSLKDRASRRTFAASRLLITSLSYSGPRRQSTTKRKSRNNMKMRCKEQIPNWECSTTLGDVMSLCRAVVQEVPTTGCWKCLVCVTTGPHEHRGALLVWNCLFAAHFLVAAFSFCSCFASMGHHTLVVLPLLS